MAKNQTKKLPQAILAEDLEIYAALKEVAGYAPVNAAYSKTALDALRTNLNIKAEADAQAAAAAAAAHDDHIAAQWDLHNAILGAKDQIVAQFGLNSNEVQAVKLKKKAEYKNPKRKTPKTL